MIKRKKSGFRARRSLGSVVLTTATFLAFLGIVWQAYQASVDDRSTQKTLPVVTAQSSPEKMRPLSEGGMVFPNQNVSIFDQIEEPFAGDPRRVERLSFFKENIEKDTPPEMAEMSDVSKGFRVIPFSRDVEQENSQALPEIGDANSDETVSLIETVANASEKIEEIVDTNVVTIKDQQKEKIAKTLQDIVNSTVAEESVAEIETASGDEDHTAIESEAKEPVSEKVAMVVPTPTREVKKSLEKKTPEAVQTIYLGGADKQVTQTKKQDEKFKAGDYTIQLGSVRSHAGAESEWKKIQAKIPSLLSTLPLHVETADLGARGVFYRIQAGMLSKDDADHICSEIKSRGVADCLVRRK